MRLRVRRRFSMDADGAMRAAEEVARQASELRGALEGPAPRGHPLQCGPQRLGDQTLFSQAAILGGDAHFPAEGAEILDAQDVDLPAPAHKHHALPGRALGQQIHRRHAVTSRHQERTLAVGRRHGKPVSQGGDHAQGLARRHPGEHHRSLAHLLV
jgi:hypothetical protein